MIGPSSLIPVLLPRCLIVYLALLASLWHAQFFGNPNTHSFPSNSSLVRYEGNWTLAPEDVFQAIVTSCRTVRRGGGGSAQRARSCCGTNKHATTKYIQIERKPEYTNTSSFSATAMLTFFGEVFSPSPFKNVNTQAEMLVGSALQIITDNNTKATSSNFLVDNTESFVTSPPYPNGVLFNTTFLNTSVSHTVVISKFTGSPMGSVLGIMGIS